MTMYYVHICRFFADYHMFKNKYRLNVTNWTGFLNNPSAWPRNRWLMVKYCSVKIWKTTTSESAEAHKMYLNITIHFYIPMHMSVRGCPRFKNLIFISCCPHKRCLRISPSEKYFDFALCLIIKFLEHIQVCFIEKKFSNCKIRLVLA